MQLIKPAVRQKVNDMTVILGKDDPTLLSRLSSRVDENFIYRPFWLDCLRLLQNCAKRGAEYYMISGYRSEGQQMALWAQGRTQSGKIVTNAKAWQSMHNYGLAIDFCRDKDIQRSGLQPDWDSKAYDILAEEAVKLGLVPGHYWTSLRDSPHVEMKLPGTLKLKDLPRDLAEAWAKIGVAVDTK